MTVFEQVSDLETRRSKYLEDAEKKRIQIAQLLGQVEDIEKNEREKKQEIARLRKQEEQKQRRAESAEQAQQVRSDVTELEEKYRNLAVGNPWYDDGSTLYKAVRLL